MIYTVGNEANYDKMLADAADDYTKAPFKLGRRPNYPGGFACRTAEDAAKLIVEQHKVGEWAVYEVDAVWDIDTKQSQNGWWHALLKDSPIIRKKALETAFRVRVEAIAESELE